MTTAPVTICILDDCEELSALSESPAGGGARYYAAARRVLEKHAGCFPEGISIEKRSTCNAELLNAFGSGGVMVAGIDASTATQRQLDAIVEADFAGRDAAFELTSADSGKAVRA